MKNPLRSIKDAKRTAQSERELLIADYRSLKMNLAAAKKVSIKKDLGTLSQEVAVWIVHKNPLVAVASAIGVGSMIGSHFKGDISSTIRQNSKRLLQHPSVLGFVKRVGAKALLQLLSHDRLAKNDVA